MWQRHTGARSALETHTHESLLESSLPDVFPNSALFGSLDRSHSANLLLYSISVGVWRSTRNQMNCYFSRKIYEDYKGRMKERTPNGLKIVPIRQIPYKTNSVVKALWIWKLKLELWTPVSTGSGETKQVP